MPLGRGIRFRFKRLGKGKAVRLAFRGSKVVESTPYHKSGGKLVKDSGFCHDIESVDRKGIRPKTSHVMTITGQGNF